MKITVQLPLPAPPLFMIEAAKGRGIIPGVTITDGFCTGKTWPVEQWMVGAFGDMICADGPVYGYDRRYCKWATVVP